jgi:hypothetical protein
MAILILSVCRYTKLSAFALAVSIILGLIYVVFHILMYRFFGVLALATKHIPVYQFSLVPELLLGILKGACSYLRRSILGLCC